MSELNPIFHDVERRAVAATVVTEKGGPILALDLLAEDGTATRLLSLNKFDAQQLLDVCQKYMLQQHSQGYSEVNTQLSEADRVELGVDKDD
jgi:hypothetical protein